MSIAYQPKDPLVLNRTLKVQEVVCQLNDGITTVSGSVATIELGETISSVVNAIFVDDSAGTAAPVAAASRVVGATSVALTLSAVPTAADSIVLRYIVSE
jgi:hypothetical protein